MMDDHLDEILSAFRSGKGDPSLIAALPDVDVILNVERRTKSDWAQAFKVDVRRTDGEVESYFMKVSFGFHGLQALKGEYEATSAIYAITPDFCPKPIAWGSLTNVSDGHFYLCTFYHFMEGVPEPDRFCEKLARLHLGSSSPDGKFGFHCTTYNGDLPQDNTWADSWEVFFANGLRHVLKIREERAGPSAELDSLLPALFEKVIPRLLRPLESNGRKIQPSLVHGDLWCGNAATIDDETEEPIVFDPSSFWAHNEYELGNWRPPRNNFDKTYFDQYLSHVPMSEPQNDFYDRNALYAVRFNLHAATFFPHKEYLQEAIDDIRRLTEKFPEGYVVAEPENKAPRTEMLDYYHLPSDIGAPMGGRSAIRESKAEHHHIPVVNVAYVRSEELQPGLSA